MPLSEHTAPPANERRTSDAEDKKNAAALEQELPLPVSTVVKRLHIFILMTIEHT